MWVHRRTRIRLHVAFRVDSIIPTTLSSSNAAHLKNEAQINLTTLPTKASTIRSTKVDARLHKHTRFNEMQRVGLVIPCHIQATKPKWKQKIRAATYPLVDKCQHATSKKPYRAAGKFEIKPPTDGTLSVSMLDIQTNKCHLLVHLSRMFRVAGRFGIKPPTTVSRSILDFVVKVAILICTD